jgi:hypothetical protein
MAVFEYMPNTSLCPVGSVLQLPAFPSFVYDRVEDCKRRSEAEAVAVARGADEVASADQTDVASRTSTPTSRRSVDETNSAVLKGRLGMYQRPMSAHGVRNQQDSTFSLAGGYEPEVCGTKITDQMFNNQSAGLSISCQLIMSAL